MTSQKIKLLRRLKKILSSGEIIFDGRNQYDPERVKAYGLTVYGVGIPAV